MAYRFSVPQAPTGVPFGNAFLIQTPEVDRMRDQAYQAWMQQRQFMQREAMSFDQQASRDMHGVRSIDRPGVLDAYSKAKSIRKQMLFDPRAQNDPRVYGQLSDNYNEAMGDLYYRIGRSTEVGQMQKDLAVSYLHNPTRYAPDFGARHTALQNTPIEQLENSEHGDLGNPDTYLFRDNTDIDSMLKRAHLAAKTTNEISAQDPNDKYATTYSKYQGVNPKALMNSLVYQLSKDPNGAYAAAHAMSAFTKDHTGLVNDEYSKITPEEWEQHTGRKEAMNLEPVHPDNPIEQYASMIAKGVMVDNPPQKIAVRQEYNKQLMAEDKFATWLKERGVIDNFRLKLEDLKSNDSVKKYQAEQWIKQQGINAGEQGKQIMADTHFDAEISKAKKGKLLNLKDDQDNTVTGYDIDATPAEKDMFKTKDEHGHTVTPRMVMVSKDEKNYIPIFETADKEDPNVARVDSQRSKPTDVESVKDDWKLHYFGKAKPIVNQKSAGSPGTGKKKILGF